MRLHAEAGEIASALRQYELCREILRPELAVAPSPETESLHQEIRIGSGRLVAERGVEAPRIQTQQSSPSNASKSKPSIAVLPFRNLNDDPAQRVMSTCLTEDVTTELSRFRSLKVVGRHWSFGEQFYDARDVGRKLNVQYVVDGTVTTVGNQIRVTARLSETGSGAQLWAERYVRDQVDPFTVQDEVARTIVSTLSGRLENAGAEQARTKHTGSLAAYDCLFRGIDLHERMTDEDEPHAREMLLKALELDPEFALAYSWLAVSYMVDWFDFGLREAFDKALVLARRALAIDDEDGRCHSVIGYVSTYHRLFEPAIYHMDRAAALTPNDIRTIIARGVLLAYLGRPAEGVEWMNTSFRLNPYPPQWYAACKGMTLYSARRYDEAAATLEGSQSCAVWTGMYLAASLARLGRWDEAHSVLKASSAKRPALRPLKYASNEPYKNRADLEHLLEPLSNIGW
jgi:adenylate cyclase